MLIAEIAWRHLSPDSRAKAAILADEFAQSGPFPRNPDMVQAACWPDDLKSWHQYAMKPWHYIDLVYNPEGLTAAPSTSTGRMPAHSCDRRGGGLKVVPKPSVPSASAAPPAMCLDRVLRAVAEDAAGEGNVVSAIRHMVVALKAHDVPLYSLTFAFANLIHFVGDVHQPLHAATRYSEAHPHGDRGGNAVHVKVDGVETNLHALWDNMCTSAKTHSLKRPLDASHYEALRTAASALEDTYKFPSSLISKSDPEVMAAESYMFAINSSYPDVEEDAELSESYLYRCKETAAARVTLAGRRLGKILEGILTDMSVNETLRRGGGEGDSGRPAASFQHGVPWWRLW